MNAAWRRVGLRGRLAVALAGVALLAVALATGLTDSGLSSRLEASARSRLDTAASHMAQLAANLYRERQGRWSAQSASELRHAAAVSGYRLAIYDPAGALVAGSAPPRGGPHARAGVSAGGRPVGALILSPLEGQILTRADLQLRAHLNVLHLIAAVVALAGGLIAAALLSTQLARPLKALTGAARRIERGDLHARVQPGGAPETATLARAFNRLAETLEREEQIRRAAAADLAHELRTPLAGIVARIEAAQDGVLEDQGANIEAMHAEAVRLSQLVESLGRLADAERPGLFVDKRPLDLTALVAARARAQRDLFAAKGVRLEERIARAHAYGDEQRIGEIVDNLLANALRYTEPGGSVQLTVAQRDGEAQIEIEDSGIGIAVEELPHIFERFWRSERSRARKSGGAGIGLAIVRELVRAHDGRIDVRSKPGEGSRFTVTLPAGRPSV